VLGLVLFHIRLPGSAIAWLAFALSFLLAIVLSFCLRFMINVVGFWTTDVRGIMGMVLLFVNFLTGFLVPLEFFPPTLRAIVTQLPFAGIISIPVNVFLEQARGADLLILLGRQLFWTVVFIGAAQLLLRAATRKLVVQGG
jgi:ABC-2 type transport system permease protein